MSNELNQQAVNTTQESVANAPAPSINDLANALTHYPINSEQNKKIYMELVRTMAEGDPKYQTDILVTYSKIARRQSILESAPWVNEADLMSMTIDPKLPHRFPYGVLSGTSCWNPFSKEFSFFDTSDYEFIPRYSAEYNLFRQQIVVAALVTDGDNLLLLKTKPGATRIDDRITMIQGHVDFSAGAYSMTQNEFLRQSTAREFGEEINTPDDFTFTFEIGEDPLYYINLNTTTTELEHFGVVYEVRVASVPNIVERVTSGEPEIHDVVSVNLRDLLTENSETGKTWSQFDNWLKPVIKTMLG